MLRTLCAVAVSVWAFAARLDAFELIVSDARLDAVFRLSDLNGSGAIEPEEASIAYGDEAPGPDLSTPDDMWLLGGALYLLDGGTLDTVLVLTDSDGDGSFLGDGESFAFYGPECAGPRLRTPTVLAFRDEVFAVADDSRVNPLVVLLQDLDGDGAACTGGESLLLYDGNAPGVDAPPGDPESLCILPDHSLLVGDAESGAIFRLADADDDGIVYGPHEVTVYHIPDRSPAHFSCLVSYRNGVLAADRAQGLVLYLEDRDGDGIVSGGEAAAFCGPEGAAPFIAEPSDLWVDASNGVWLVDNGTDQVLFMADRNADGDALDPGEALVVLPDAGILSQPTSLVVVAEPEGPGPRITGISAGEGSPRGGDTVTISGERMGEAIGVFFGDAAVPELRVEDGETITVVTPAGSGTVPVTVASVRGADVLAEGWRYVGEALAVDRMSPDEGPAEGGFQVVLEGSGLAGAEAWFDGIPAEVASSEPDRLVVVAPPHEPGEVTVLVGDGVEEVTLTFRYVAGFQFIRGDAEGDGAIAINDAIVILSFLFADGTLAACQDRADVNDDGAVNIADPVSLLGYLFGGGAPPPAPFPGAGPDPTPDGLPCP